MPDVTIPPRTRLELFRVVMSLFDVMNSNPGPTQARERQLLTKLEAFRSPETAPLIDAVARMVEAPTDASLGDGEVEGLLALVYSAMDDVFPGEWVFRGA